MPSKKTVVLGMYGPTWDAVTVRDGRALPRWRPTVGVCIQNEMPIDRFELLTESQFMPAARSVIDDVASLTPNVKMRLHEVDFSDPWDFEQVYAALFDFVASYPFDLEREEYFVHISTGTHVIQISWFLLAESRFIPGRLLQSAPPAGGPETGILGSVRVIDLQLERYDRIARRFGQRRQAGQAMLKDGIETRNPLFNRIIDRIEHVVLQSREPILLTGPTGVGKTRLARRAYQLKKQRRLIEGRLVEVNCATLRGDQAMSALFGHRKGAFTGASADRDGLLLTANGGMLFLDEIGELGADEQAMLLHALEDKTFLPVGADNEVKSEFQLIVGTNRNLNQAVREGRFREDLLARIRLWTFELPALRERREDIEPNLVYELDQASVRLGLRVSMNDQARDRFMAFALSEQAIWADNFRDLNAAVIRMATLADGGRITLEVVEEEVGRLQAEWAATPWPDVFEELADLVNAGKLTEVDRVDAAALAEVVRVCRRCQNMAEASRELFAVSRRSKANPNDSDRLRKYLARFGLTFADVESTG